MEGGEAVASDGDWRARVEGGAPGPDEVRIVRLPLDGSSEVDHFGMLSASGGTAWLAQLGSQTGYAAGVLGPIVLAGVGMGMIIAPAINTGTFGVAPQDAGVASATVTVGRCSAARSAPRC